jgi:O-antigen/teichoic acid export membrane protein
MNSSERNTMKRSTAQQTRDRVVAFAKRPAVHGTLSQGIIATCNLAAGVVAARCLSVEGRGTAAAIVTTMLLAVYLLDLGATPALQYWVARYGQVPKTLARDPVLIAVGTVSVVAVATSPIWLDVSMTWLTVSALLVFAIANTVGRFANAILLGRKCFAEVNFNRTVQGVAWLLVMALAMTSWPTPQGFVLAFATSWVIQAAMAIRSLKHVTGRSGQMPSTLTKSRAFWSYALPAHVAGQNVIDAWRLEIVLGVYLLSNESIAMLAIAGSYGAQVRIASIAVAPIVNVRAAEGGALRNSLARYVIFTGVIGTILALAAPLLIPQVFGEQYGPAVLPAAMYCVAAVLSSLRSLVGEALRGRGRQYATVFVELVVAMSFLSVYLVVHSPSVAAVAGMVLGAQAIGAALALGIVRGTRNA